MDCENYSNSLSPESDISLSGSTPSSSPTSSKSSPTYYTSPDARNKFTLAFKQKVLTQLEIKKISINQCA